MASQVESRSLFADRKTELKDGNFQLPPIAALTTDTDRIGNGEVPEGFRAGDAPPRRALPESGEQRGMPWEWTAKPWAAANTFTHPLYFEDRMLERHGHRRFGHFQPLASGGRFLAQVSLLSYLSTISPPWECESTLGHYRVGNCVPAFLQRPPYKRKAVAAQATSYAIGGLIWP